MKPMTLKLPAIDPADLAEQRGSTYPEPFKSRMGDRMKKRLADACSLTQFGVNLVTLGPGGQSALRHWHTHEDEFVYVLEGEVTLITDGGEQRLRAGQCAGYPAGSSNAHHFINRSGKPTRYLEVGSRNDQDQAHYPDDDLVWMNQATQQTDNYNNKNTVAAHKNGKPY